MYHDQVLTPIKSIFKFNAINITAGLPFIRVSPDHGPNEKMISKNISDPTSIIQSIPFFERSLWNLNQKENLGQNFLIDDNVLDIITNLGNINTNSTILEIGPGTGNLTEKIILKKPKRIVLVEKDESLSKNLEKKFNGKVEVINKDFLDLCINNIKCKNLLIFGNLPYNVASEILIKIIKNNKNFY